MKNIFLSFLISSIFTSATSACSNSFDSTLPSSFSGSYVGIAAGGRFTEIFETTKVGLPAFNLEGSYPGRSVCSRGGEGGLVLGYGIQPFDGLPALYVGGEVTYFISRVRGGARYRNVPFQMLGALAVLTGEMGQSYSQKDALTVVARAGYAFPTFMPYVKAGVENGRFQTDVYLNSVKVLHQARLNLGQAKWEKRHSAPVVGGGIDFKLTNNLLFGVEGSFTFYKTAEERKIVATVTPAQAAAIAAAVVAVPGAPALPVVAGNQIQTTVKTGIRASRCVHVRLTYKF